jgi:hypothetical protein
MPHPQPDPYLDLSRPANACACAGEVARGTLALRTRAFAAAFRRAGAAQLSMIPAGRTRQLGTLP